jgi:hypothetical protein
VPAALQSDASAKAALPMVLTMTYIYWGIAVAALITFAAGSRESSTTCRC